MRCEVCVWFPDAAVAAAGGGGGAGAAAAAGVGGPGTAAGADRFPAHPSGSFKSGVIFDFRHLYMNVTMAMYEWLQASAASIWQCHGLDVHEIVAVIS